jgi:hypothetical protein
MPRTLVIIVSTALGAATALGVVACGGSDGPAPSIGRGAAATLLSELQQVEANVNVGSCAVASTHAQALLDDINKLPDSVDPDVRRALDSGASQLTVLLTEPGQCESQTGTTNTNTTNTATTKTNTTPTQTTTTTPTQTTTTTPTQPTTPTQTTTTGGGTGGTGL